MSDLISRSALIEELKECLDEENIQHTLEYFGVYDIIRSQPTVEAKPVVHCKDCCFLQVCKTSQLLGLDGYCSRGEKHD